MIFHLTVIIVLLLYQIDSNIRREESFVLDFSKQEEMERKEKMAALEEDLLEKLEEKIAAARNAGHAPVRNIAVDAGSYLKDDRGTDADQLYRDAERLARELKGVTGNAIEEDARNETVELPGKDSRKEQTKTYSGPSVVSYTLEGRKASLLKIPAYRCYGSGEVTVIITVDNSGRVVNAKVQEEASSSDKCLREFAVRAARLSRFSSSSAAPARQHGEIVYRFIAQ
ncbi:MAG: energy transducer TonB [Bacteroidales bacterium]|nr:energy transducer TonB [Bacteroidales bacterium]